ncbi:hypothetical protein ASPSYDRAFT_1167762 [Aspergillus sydowii CBS 593.65]|uniref:Zn(2)-C6 fungal-type domain-containing protein n=1 Tax=Aspergillus sydowii CBS 593.65 TaxID=1036612 RepID=A0A1L9TT13_9EURO|nr:uncharacterized protein ASPSYDRAFT_1167762 [Aspergillus sydowii CBS 593.65]OJJ62423.1 hypothetical protein ASPSYDRAFT_1167762 [Aspergillus sydowii CBS 593.65]
MGGIPYTSGGCGTCRRRKVKCDETRPECLRCTKYGHKCTGYDNKKVFVHGRTGKVVEKPGPGQSNSNLALVKGTKIDGTLNANPLLRCQLFTNFIESYLPPRAYLRDTSGQNILQTIPDLTADSVILEKAGICLAAVYLATQNQDDWLFQYSSRLYGNTLRSLHSKITSGAKLSPDMLYTTIILQIYELINCSPPGFGAWIAHVQGGVAISMHTSVEGEETVAEKLFRRQLKFVALCDAIGKRQAPYLYNTQLWRNDHTRGQEEPDPVDQFIDLLAKCTATIEQVDRFVVAQPASPGKAFQTGGQLLRACLKLEENLHQTCISMQQKLGLPRICTRRSFPQGDFRNTLRTELFAPPLQFASLTCAESHMLYWSSLILLYPLIGELYFIIDGPDINSPVPIHYYSANGESPPSGTTTITTTLSDDVHTAYTALAEHYANEICRSVLYCIQPDMKTLGAQQLLAPLSQSLQFFHVEGLTSKLRWCQNVLTVLSHMGLGIAPFLKDMVWPQYRSAQGRRHAAQGLLNT